MFTFRIWTDYSIGVLRKLLTAMMVLSLLGTVSVGILWVRGVHGHFDEFGFPWNGAHYDFQSVNDRWMIRTTHSQSQMVLNRIDPEPFKSVMGYTLILPAIWLAIWVRRKIPRPARRGFEPMPRLKKL